MRRADRYRLAFAEDRFRDRNDLAITAILAVGFNIAEHTADQLLIRAFRSNVEPLPLIIRKGLSP